MRTASAARVATRYLTAGTWGYLPWMNDGALDGAIIAREELDLRPAYRGLEEAFEEAQKGNLYDKWFWVGTLYAFSSETGPVTRPLVKRALGICDDLLEDEGFDKWAQEWSSPEKLKPAVRLVRKHLAEALKKNPGDKFSLYRWKEGEKPSNPKNLR